MLFVGIYGVCNRPLTLDVLVGLVSVPVFSLIPLGWLGRTDLVDVLIVPYQIRLPADPGQLLDRVFISL